LTDAVAGGACEVDWLTDAVAGGACEVDWTCLSAAALRSKERHVGWKECLFPGSKERGALVNQGVAISTDYGPFAFVMVRVTPHPSPRNPARAHADLLAGTQTPETSRYV
jgi:hypothetical protein